MKRFILLLLMLFIHQISTSQNEWHIGLEAGPSLTSLRGNAVSDKEKALLSFYVSPVIEYKFSGHFSIKTGIGYEAKGSRVSYNYYDLENGHFETIEYKTKLTYLTLPLLVKYRGKGKVQPFFNTGLFLGYNTSPYRVSDFDYGIVAGGGVNFNVLKSNFSIELRNNYGIKNIYDSELLPNRDLRTNATYILIGYSFII
jgi:hypothetical protein